MNPENSDNQAREGGGGTPPFGVPSASGATDPGSSAIVALFRIGTRKARLAAALMLVVTGLVTQTANQALAEARQTVLYLDAPAVSTDRATNAGEVAEAFAKASSDPRLPISPYVLAWLGVRQAAENDTGTLPGTPPQGAAAAFASVTALDAQGTSAVTAEAAFEAGETMLAQVEDGAPSEGENPSEEELGAVRPELGDGTQASGEKPPESYEAPSTAPRAEQPSSPDLASSPEPIAEPDGGEGLALEAPAVTPSSGPAETEFAAAPSEDASPIRGSSLGAEPAYGATGPLSEPAAAPSVGPADESEAQEPEAQEGEVRGPGGSELARVGPPSAARKAPAHDTGHGDGAAHADPATSPEPAEEVAYEEPAPAPDTGPTSTPSDDFGSAPTSSPPPADDTTTEEPSAHELASASPAPGESSEDGGLGQDASRGPVSEVVIVQVSQTGEGGDASAVPEESAPPADDAKAAPAELTETPTDAERPQEESTPEPELEPQPEDQVSLPTGELSDESPIAEDPTGDEGALTASAPASAPADDGSAGASETTSPSPTEESSGDPTEAPTDQTVDEAVGDQHGATSADEPASPAPDEGAAAQDAAPSPDGGQNGRPDADEQTPDPGNASAPRLTAEPDPEGQAPQAEAPELPSRDRGDDRRDRSDSGVSDMLLPDERIESVEHGEGGEGGAEVVRQTIIRGSGGEQQSVTEFRDEVSSGGDTSELPVSTAPRADDGWAPRKSAKENPQNLPQGYGLDPGGSGLRGSSRAGKEPAARGWRSRQREDATPDDVDEESSEGSQPANYLIRTVDPTGAARSLGRNKGVERRAAAQHAARRKTRQERTVRRQQIAAEATARRADHMVERRAEHREARRAKIFAARVAKRHAEHRANRIAAAQSERHAERQAVREQAAHEQATIRNQRPQNRLAAGASNAQTMPAGGRARNAPGCRGPAPRPTDVRPAPVRQVRTRHSAPVEQPPAPWLPPARRVPPARLDPAPQVRSQVQPEVQAQPQQRVAPGGVGELGVGGAPGGVPDGR